MSTANKILLTHIFIAGGLITANAQKLPNVQQASVHVPANIKIDGKALEWNNTFRAYNHATDIFYTVSNDDNNLYLTAQATDRVVINKIISGGISFTITTPGKKNDKGGVSITYPVFEKGAKPVLSINNKLELEHPAAPSLQPDSIVTVNNNRFADKSKLVMVTGIKGIDTLISIYNENNIKTAARFDNKMAYTYELSVPLKYIETLLTDHLKFAYHITLNGESKLIKRPAGNDALSVQDPISAAKLNAELAAVGQSNAPTDFWGEYTLAKK